MSTSLPILSPGAEMLARYGLVPRRPEVFDASMTSDFMACPSMFYLRHILGLRGKQREVALSWGGCWHHVMYAFMHALDDEGEFDLAVEAGLLALDKNYPPWLTPENDKKVKRSKMRMAEQFFAYVEGWNRERKDYDILRHEQYFRVWFEDVNLHWCGRMDSLRRAKINKKLRAWDYKTTSSMGPRYFNQFEISFQFPGYVAASQLLFTDEIKEITIDVMYTLSKSFKFFRRTFRYDEARLLEWRKNMKMITDRINRCLDESLDDIAGWEKNWSRCNEHYGTCQFLPVHSLNPRGEGRLLDLRDNYMVDRWDPADMEVGEDT